MRVGVLGRHRADIAGQEVDLPILAKGDGRAIVLMNVLDCGVAFGERAGRALAAAMAPRRPEVVLGTATLGIPVALEVTRALGLDRYVVAQKSPKVYLGDPLAVALCSSTTRGAQRLYVDRANVRHLAGRRVAVVDDVAASGESVAASLALARAAGAEVVAIGVIATEGCAWRARLGTDARLLVRLGHIPQYEIRPDGALALRPESLEPRRPV